MIVTLLAFPTQLLRAAEVTITIPDDRLRAVLKEGARWHHLWKHGTTYNSDEALVRALADAMLPYVSFNKLSSLEALGATVTLTYDTPQEVLQE